MFFDLNADRTRFRYDRNDHQFRVTLGEGASGVLKQIVWGDAAPRIEIDPQPGAKVRWTAQAGGVHVEGLIPAAAFHVWGPMVGHPIGFDFRINTNIEWYGRGYEQSDVQIPRSGGWASETVEQNPANWASLRFE